MTTAPHRPTVGMLRRLARADPALGEVITRVAPYPGFPQAGDARGHTHFTYLSRSIVFQQLAGKAAATIWGRFAALGSTARPPGAEEVLRLPDARMRSAGLSGNKTAAAYAKWAIYNTQPYVSGTHGGRFVNNFANAKAKNYELYEKAGKMPAGAILAKDSFQVRPNGKTAAGPLFLMEKMHGGFSKASADWRYSLIMASGQTVGVTKGKGSKNVQFCAECHISVAEDQDSMLFLPEEVRRN